MTRPIHTCDVRRAYETCIAIAKDDGCANIESRIRKLVDGLELDCSACAAAKPLRLDIESPIPSRASRPALATSAPIDVAAEALEHMQELVAFVARDDRDGAMQRAERATSSLELLLRDYGVELAEVLPRKRCADCRSHVVDFRMTPRPDGRREPVCVSCSISRTAEARERPTDEGVLARAASIVRDRGTTYGDPSSTFARVASLWTTILGSAVSAPQVALCMIALKVARLSEAPAHRDSWDDVAGYADCGEQVSRKGSAA